MQLHPIQQWFDNEGSYQQGIDLFQKHGGNPFLVRTFKSVQSEATMEMLRDHLQRMIPETPQAPSSDRFRIEGSSHRDALPREVKQLNEQKATYFKEMSHLHSLLTEYEEIELAHGHELKVKFKNFSPEEADKAAIRILHLDNLINGIWSKLDHYHKHGKLPEDLPIQPKDTDPVNLHKRLTNLRTYISRDPLNPKAEKWKKEIEAIKSRLQ